MLKLSKRNERPSILVRLKGRFVRIAERNPRTRPTKQRVDRHRPPVPEPVAQLPQRSERLRSIAWHEQPGQIGAKAVLLRERMREKIDFDRKRFQRSRPTHTEQTSGDDEHSTAHWTAGHHAPFNKLASVETRDDSKN